MVGSYWRFPIVFAFISLRVLTRMEDKVATVRLIGIKPPVYLGPSKRSSLHCAVSPLAGGAYSLFLVL
mgnify:CR=1 FL=1